MAEPKKFSPHVLRQLCILSICRFAEPIAMTSIFPYLYYMIKSFGVPESDVSYYAGLTAASFSFSQFLTGLFWGRISDVVGRRPLILIGLSVTMISLLLFGFATSLWMAIAARTLAGLVNGNVGILRTVVAELVPERELQPRAFSAMPLMWNIGSVIGPMIGGALADPLRSHPDWFGGSRPGFFVKFPYALPNIVCAAFFLIGLPIGFLFIEETLETKRGQTDIGLRLGEKLTRFIRPKNSEHHHHYKTIDEEVDSESSDSEGEADVASVKEEPKNDTPPMMDAFTPQSTLNIVYYTVLALHTITFDQLLPVLMAYPPQDPSEFKLPFQFSGGLGMSSGEIGRAFSIYGIFGMLLQFFAFPPVVNKFGTLRCLRIVSYIFPLVYFLVPMCLVLPTTVQRPFIYTVMGLKNIGAVFAYPCSTILLTNSTPTLRLLGTLNGIAVTTAALGRGLGPAIGGALFTSGQKANHIILPWWVVASFSTLCIVASLFIVDKGGIDHQKPAEEVSVVEGEQESLIENREEAVTPTYGTTGRTTAGN